MAHLTPEDRERIQTVNDTSWKPERKIVGGALAVIIMAILQGALPDLEIPVGVEGAIAIVAAYLLPNKSTATADA